MLTRGGLSSQQDTLACWCCFWGNYVLWQVRPLSYINDVLRLICDITAVLSLLIFISGWVHIGNCDNKPQGEITTLSYFKRPLVYFKAVLHLNYDITVNLSYFIFILGHVHMGKYGNKPWIQSVLFYIWTVTKFGKFLAIFRMKKWKPLNISALYW